MARLEFRVMQTARGTSFSDVFRPRFLALAAATAVCLVWFIAKPASRTAGLPSTAAFSLEDSRDRKHLHAVELDALMKALPGETTAPAPILVADFERIEDLAKVTIVGSGAPSLAINGRMGRRALRTDAGPADAPAEVMLAVPTRVRSRAIQTVSAWIMASAGPVEVALELNADSGTDPAAIPARRVEPGAWQWVTFTIPGTTALGAGAPLSEVRLRLTGAGPVLLDQVEVWCTGGSHDR
jgi:hypothetical protein